MNPAAVLAEQLRRDHGRVSVVVPAFNEDANIVDCVNTVVQAMNALRCPFEVVVVDDGSWDDTYHLVERLRYDEASLKVLKNHRNEGKAAALRKGFAEADGDIVVTMDSDGQHLPFEIPTKKKPSPEEVEEAKQWATWEKEASTFKWHYDAQETFYVLEGDVTVTWRGGELSFSTGDWVTFPAGLDCTWHVQKKIRKHYVFEE